MNNKMKIKAIIHFNVNFIDSIPTNTDSSVFDNNDKILLTRQTNVNENGVYIVKTLKNTIKKSWTRIDFKDELSTIKYSGVFFMDKQKIDSLEKEIIEHFKNKEGKNEQ